MYQGNSLVNSGGAEPRRGITVGDLARILRKHYLTAIISFIVVIVLATVYLFITPPKYIATAQTFATYSTDDSHNNDNYANINNAGSYIGSQVKSYPSLVKTSAVLDPVIDELHLQDSVTSLSNSITVTNPSNTAFINIAVESTDPSYAATVANAVATSFQNIVQTSLYSNQQQSPVKISIVQRATVPSHASSPNITMVLVLSIIAGLCIGCLAAILKDIFSRKIQDERELANYINAPVIGRIPQDPLLNTNKPVLIAEPTCPVAEDLRRIGTNLSFIAPIPGTNSRLIVASAVGPDEGKTTISVNLAVTLAEGGASVLLIDADLRHPSVAKKMDIDGSVGLSHVLSGQASVKDVVQRYWKANLHVMPAGPKPPNAAVLLNSQIMSELVDHAVRQYDFVIIDTAPLIVANEAASLAKKGSGLVLVSRREITLKKQLKETVEELRNMDTNVTGIIVNNARVDKKALAGSNYYYYSSTRDTEKVHTHKN